jgi:hypothetical protein
MTEAALERDREGATEVALDVHGLIEVGFENADVPEADGFPLGARGLEAEVNQRFTLPILGRGAVRVGRPEADARLPSDALQDFLQ